MPRGRRHPVPDVFLDFLQVMEALNRQLTDRLDMAEQLETPGVRVPCPECSSLACLTRLIRAACLRWIGSTFHQAAAGQPFLSV